MSEANNLFAYGTLMWPEVLERVIGRRLTGEAAVLQGYRRLRVKNEPYPVIIPAAGAAVEGMVYRSLTAEEFRRLDLFEGEEYARRQVAPGRMQAFTYVLTREWRHIADTRPWIPAHFGQEQLDAFCAGYKNWSDLP